MQEVTEVNVGGISYRVVGPRYWVNARVFIQRLEIGRWGRFSETFDNNGTYWMTAEKTRVLALDGMTIHHKGPAWGTP